jgi:adenine C2-methylase RlmN of 23S rRNA A2503 and tRNA A37
MLPELISENSIGRITYDYDMVSNVINSIISSKNTIKAIQLIRLDKLIPNNNRPIKAVFGSPVETIDILISKKKIINFTPTFQHWD